MNASIHRVGLAAAAIAVLVTVGGIFVADGYFTASRTASAATPVATVSVTPTAAATGTLPPEVVYVRPAPSPAVIRVTRTAPPQAPQVVHVTVPSVGGEGTDGGGNGFEGGSD